ncbi:MAG: hypothetical protein CMJ21_04980 [Phycisphaerae bacterium]|nr:hypothetical protein [Phycisphaerae bacterium]
MPLHVDEQLQMSDHPLIDRVGELLETHDCLYGMICRDATLTDIELMAQAGYHVVWLDLEHGPQSTQVAIELGRTISHLGMVPLVRIPELSRTYMQILLDGGIQIMTLPDVRSVEQTRRFVQLGKYPPMGQRGVSSSSAGIGFNLGNDPEETLRQANQATYLMVMIESDEGFDALDTILAVDGIGMITIGPADWATSLGLFGSDADSHLAPKIERVLRAAADAGVICTMTAGNAERTAYYRDLGARIIFAGVDVNLTRRTLCEALDAVSHA